MKKTFLLSICFVFFYGYCTAQVKSKILTADSLASGNTKDVLTSFFQLAFNNLTSAKKELNFNSNPFAVMLKANPNLAIDTNYYKYRPLRKLNFGFGLKLDSSYRFNGFSSGIKYAIINKRDTTTSPLLFTKLDKIELGKETPILNSELSKYADDTFKDNPTGQEAIAFTDNVNSLFNNRTPFNKLDTSFQRIVKRIVKDKQLLQLKKIVNIVPASNPVDTSLLSIEGVNSQIFDSLKNSIKNALLWTAGISDTTYKDQFFFSNILLNTELVKGLGANKPGSNWEFDVRASLNLLDDTLRHGRDLRRCIFYTEPGFNWVLRTKTNDQSLAELKFSASYLHNFSALYPNEKRDVFTMNSTLRIRIIDDIWIPLEIKYDPSNGNVFGFLNVRANFTSLGKALNPNTNK